MMENIRQIKSYVWHNSKCYFVSTIERDSSAAVIPARRFNETLVWEYDWDARERGELIHNTGHPRGNILAHWSICDQLYRHGCIDTESQTD